MPHPSCRRRGARSGGFGQCTGSARVPVCVQLRLGDNGNMPYLLRIALWSQSNCWPMILIGGSSDADQGGQGAFQEAPQVGCGCGRAVVRVAISMLEW